jgi:NAD(P)-dependent dehydrogenase (short-subunit alcohol dehydrogenase family)
MATRRAIVTGGSSGIGRETALVLAEHGCDVAITYRSGKQRADEVLAEIEGCGRKAWAIQVDFERPIEAAAAIERLAARMGGVEVLVNNAAVSPTAEFIEETPAALATTLDTNLVGPFLCAQAIARGMVTRGHGVIVNVTSVLDRAPLAGKSSYCAAKAGLAMLTRVMALELARHGIRVLAVAPGHTATPMNFADRDVGDAPAIPVVPLGRAARAREVAETIAFAASEEAAYVTGTSILVDGGMLLVTGAQVLEEEAPHLDGPSYRSPRRRGT